MDRHDRRLAFNMGKRDLVRKWAEENGVELKISNNGHHWRFKRGRRNAEWWPSSAKMVLQRQYNADHHIYDHEQAIEVLRRHFLEEKA